MDIVAKTIYVPLLLLLPLKLRQKRGFLGYYLLLLLFKMQRGKISFNSWKISFALCNRRKSGCCETTLITIRVLLLQFSTPYTIGPPFLH